MGMSRRGMKQLRVLKASLAHLPASVTKVSLRSDTAGYQGSCCSTGEEGPAASVVIDFAISATT